MTESTNLTGLLSPQLRKHTEAFVYGRIQELASAKDGEELSRELHIPFLGVSVPPADILAMESEATAAEQPATADWLKRLVDDGYIKQVREVEFIRLEPGHSRSFAGTPGSTDNLLSDLVLNLSAAGSSHWLFKRWGEMPVIRGAAYAIDGSQEYTVWNNSREAKVFLRVQGEQGPSFFRAIADSVAHLKPKAAIYFAGQKARTAARKEPLRIEYALWNFWPKSDSLELLKRCRSITTHYLQLHAPKPLKIRQDHLLHRILRDIGTSQDWAVILRPGNILNSQFFNQIERTLLEANENTLLFAQLLDRGEKGFGFHPHLLLINLKKWRALGSPQFALPSKHQTRLLKPECGPLTDESPAWLRHSFEEWTHTPRLFGWNIVDTALRNKFMLECLPRELVTSVKVLYPQNSENTQALLSALDRFDTDEGLTRAQLEALEVLRKDTWTHSDQAWSKRENYWEIEAHKPKHPLTGIISTATGFKELFALKQHGFFENTKIIYFDADSKCLELKKFLFENWDGRGLPGFLLKHRPELPLNEITERWREDLENWGGEDAFSRTFNLAKNLSREFIHAQVLEDPRPLTDRLKTIERGDVAVCFGPSGRGQWKFEDLEDRKLRFVTALLWTAETEGHSVTVYGSDSGDCAF